MLAGAQQPLRVFLVQIRWQADVCHVKVLIFQHFVKAGVEVLGRNIAFRAAVNVYGQSFAELTGVDVADCDKAYRKAGLSQSVICAFVGTGNSAESDNCRLDFCTIHVLFFSVFYPLARCAETVAAGKV
jgi:hypothetical protein